MHREVIRIGTYQGPIEEGDVDKNIEHVLRVVQEAEKDQVHFLCFPEAYLTGYTPQAIAEASLTLDDLRLNRLFEATRSRDMVLIVGMSEWRNSHRFNTCLVLHKGKIIGVHRKTILTDYDRQYFQPGKTWRVFRAHQICFGVAICHETSFVEPALLMRWKGARVLFTPHYNAIPMQGLDTSDGKVTYWSHRTMVLNNHVGLATLLKMVVVRSNIIRLDANGIGSGDASIWDMDGNLVASGEPFSEAVVQASFPESLFSREHWIDRREIPYPLIKQIQRAAFRYLQLDAQKRTTDEK